VSRFKFHYSKLDLAVSRSLSSDIAYGTFIRFTG
jgi:hypothetical protein